MIFIKVKNTSDHTILINLSYVKEFYSIDPKITWIGYNDPEDCVKCNLPIEAFEKVIKTITDTGITHYLLDLTIQP